MCISLTSFVWRLCSSCSGRISCYADKKNKGIDWIIVKHRTVAANEITNAIASRSDLTEPSAPLVMLKCEPFILHVLCKDLQAASQLYHIAMASGYRESGIGIGNKKTMVAIRTTSFSLEFPIGKGSQLFLNRQDFETVVAECNMRLLTNFNRLDRLLAALKKGLVWPTFHYSRNLLPTKQHLPLLNRYGHVSFGVPSGEGMVVMSVGGSGGGASGSGDSRNVSLHAMHCGMPVNSSTDLLVDWSAALGCTMHGAVGVFLSARRRVVIVSGGRQSPLKPLPAIMSVCEVCTPNGQSKQPCVSGRTLTWREVGVVPAARWGHTLTSFDDERMLLLGGRGPTEVFGDAYFLQMVSAEVALSLIDDRCSSEPVDVYFLWTKIPSANPLAAQPPPLFFHAACSIGKRILLMSGGLGPSALDTEFTGGDATFCSERADACAWVLTPGAGAESYVCPSPLTELNVSSEVECVDSSELAAALTWVKVELCEEDVGGGEKIMASSSRCVSGRFGHSMTYLGGKSVVFVGGAHFVAVTAANEQQSVEVWDLSVTQALEGPPSVSAMQRFEPVTGEGGGLCGSLELDMGGTRCHHQVVYDAKQKVLVVCGGGLSCGGLFGAEYCSTVMLKVAYQRESPGDSSSRIEVEAGIECKPQATEGSLTPSRAASSTQMETPAILVPKKRLRATKVFLESKGWLDKSVRISPPWGLLGESPAESSAEIECFSLFHAESADFVSCRAEELPASLLERKIGCIDDIMAVPVSREFYGLISGSLAQGQETANRDRAACDVDTFHKLHTLLVADVVPPVRNRDLLKVQGPVESLKQLPLKVPPPADRGVALIFIRQNCMRSKSAMASIHDVLVAYLRDMIPRVVGNAVNMQTKEEDLAAALAADIPNKFEVVGDVLMISESSLRRDEWERHFPADVTVASLWEGLMHCYNTRGIVTDSSKRAAKRLISRIARKAEVDLGPKRESRVRLLYPNFDAKVADTTPGRSGVGWVELVENGIRYGFDITKVM